jgi:hypothetical protein
MLIPMWKVRRELRATLEQIHALIIQMCFPLIRFKNHFFPMHESQSVQGQKVLGTRVVVYLVFPDGDDLFDRLEALDYFLGQGSSVICVVNGNLSPHWMDQFCLRCAFVLIKENNGYDFGGYQSGILFLNNLKHDFDHLHVINDSVIIPIVLNEAIFRDIESTSNSGFGGAMALPMKKPDSKIGCPNQVINLTLSYWLYFSGHVARTDCFQTYWSRYIATRSKALTLRYGERGLSSHMAFHGYPSNALYTLHLVSKILREQPPEILFRTLQYASFTDDKFAAKCAQLLIEYETSIEWSEAARNFIIEVAEKRNFLHSFCYLAFGLLGVPFIKKTKFKLPLLMRQQYITAVEAGHMSQPPTKAWDKLKKISS